MRINVAKNPKKLNGTMRSAKVSALLCTPAFRFSELSISSIILLIFVFDESAFTLTTMLPSSTTVPANTVIPSRLATGRGSPVIDASFTVASPDTTTPSTGITLPVCTLILSPSESSEIGISTSELSVTSHTLSVLIARLSVSTAFVRAWV